MTLHQEIKEELGNRTIERLPLPDYFATALTPAPVAPLSGGLPALLYGSMARGLSSEIERTETLPLSYGYG